jgi:predicted TIM-barrel fold metal-dependent hydrolase
VRQAVPGRFSCLALFDRHYYDNPRETLQAAFEREGLQGLLVKTPNPFEEIVTPALAPVWAACAERGYPVVLKNGTPATARRLLAAAPGLKVVFSHFAGASGPIEEFRERLAIVAGEEHATIDSGGLTYRHRYPFPRCQELLHEAVERVGAAKIAWGSDYPRPGLVVDTSYQQQIDFVTVECTFLSDAQREEVLSGTALRVYAWGE